MRVAVFDFRDNQVFSLDVAKPLQFLTDNDSIWISLLSATFPELTTEAMRFFAGDCCAIACGVPVTSVAVASRKSRRFIASP